MVLLRIYVNHDQQKSASFKNRLKLSLRNSFQKWFCTSRSRNTSFSFVLFDVKHPVCLQSLSLLREHKLGIKSMSHSSIDYIKDQRKMKGRYSGCFTKQSDLRLSYANQQRSCPKRNKSARKKITSTTTTITTMTFTINNHQCQRQQR